MTNPVNGSPPADAVAPVREISARSAPASRGFVTDVFVRVFREPVGIGAGAIITLFVLLAIFAPLVAPYDPLKSSVDVLQSPSGSHLLGTDELGRDLLSRLIYGARISLYVGLIAVIVGIGIGTLVGLVSGFLGGTVDLVVQRFVDALLAFPGIVFALVIVSVLGPSTFNALLAISILIAPAASRVIRSAVLPLRESVYVEAARSIGATNTRIMLRHILPNVVAPVLILASALFGGAILIEASLSFLGMGTQAPNPSWGLTLSVSGRTYMERAPWLSIAPGLAITITVLCFNLLGDVLRDVLDPRLRGST